MPGTLAKKAWGGEENLVRCIKNGSCCLKDLGGTEFVEWKDVAEKKLYNDTRKKVCEQVCKQVRKRPHQDEKYEQVITSMFDEAKLDWTSVGCSELEENGILVGELNRRLSKAVEAMERACRWSETSFNRLMAMSNAGKLSSEGTEGMRTLSGNIKARLHRAHPYIMCCNTHRCNFNLFMITSDPNPPQPRHTLGSQFLLLHRLMFDGCSI